jgi:phage FluMu protein Com
MAVQQVVISRGKAVISNGGLRCNNALIVGGRSRTCNKLLVKANASGQIAGCFRCDKCKGEVEVHVPQRHDY